MRSEQRYAMFELVNDFLSVIFCCFAKDILLLG